MSESTVETQIPFDDRTGESEDEVVSRLSAQRANVSATDWTIETLVTQMRKGRIDLEPSFQRRAAWAAPLKSKFIESCILAYPIPQLVLAEKKDRPGHFIVIDGKQRLLSLRQYYSGLTPLDSDGFKPFRLSTVTVLESIKNYGLDRVQREKPEYFDAFETHTIRTVVIRNWESDDFLYALFLRLNTGSVPLSPQELRQALVPGPFVQYADETSGDSPGLRLLLGNDGPDRRMVDAELLIRLVGMHSGAVAYRGNLKDFLDKTCAELNDDWSVREVEVVETVEQMELAIIAAVAVFGRSGVARKWTNDHYERAFNRAIFDVQIGALMTQEAREAALDNGPKVVEAFQRLCNEDSAFARSITTTTKTGEAFRKRYTSWYAAFHEVTEVSVQLPAALPPSAP